MTFLMQESSPPHDLQAEESVIASLLVDPGAADAVLPLLDAKHFYSEHLAWTYAACAALHGRGESINQVTVAHELDREGKLEEAGGLTFLSDLIYNLPTPIGVEDYALIVRRDATYRQMISAAMTIGRLAYEAGPDLDDALAKADAIVTALRGAETAKGWVRLSTLLEPYLEPPDDEEAQPYQGRVRTGLGDLDDLLGGLNPSDLVIVAARTGVGKTALMLNFARNAAVGQGARVAVFSLEMAGEQLAQRLLAGEAKVDSHKLRLGMHNEQEEARIMHGWGVLSQCEIYVDDSHSLDVAALRSKSFQLQREHGLDLVVVDYLQLMHGERGARNDNRVQEVGLITRSLKQLARELNVPIVAGSQLSRATEQRANHLPMLSDLRESGSIEQDADVVLFIHREEVYTKREEWEALHGDKVKEPYPKGIAQLIVAKHRHGPQGSVEARFLDELSKFENMTEHAGEPATRPLL